MIVLSRDPAEPGRLAGGAPRLQRTYGMPIDPRPRPRPVISEPACRAVVACQLHAPAQADRLLRRFRVLIMRGGLPDDPAMLEDAAADAGLDAGDLRAWVMTAEVGEALEEHARAARDPGAVARLLGHRLGGGRTRYSAPSYVLTRTDGTQTATVPGFNPFEVHDIVLANLAPELERRPSPGTVEEALEWAGEPLATAEVAALLEIDATEARTRLAGVADPIAAGADFYWRL